MASSTARTGLHPKTPYTCHNPVSGCPGPLLSSPAPLHPPCWPPGPAPAAAAAKASILLCLSAPPSLSYVSFSFKGRAVEPSQPLKPSRPGRGPSPSWAGGRPIPAGPSVLAGTNWGRRGWAVRLSVPNTGPGQACPMMPSLSEWAGCGLDWADASGPGRVQPGDIWGRDPAAASLWCQHNCQTQCAGQAAATHRHAHARAHPRSRQAQARPGRVAGPARLPGSGEPPGEANS